MDDVYEFESNEYRVASMQIKATGYDILTGISKKEKSFDNNQDTLNQLTNINNNIVELLDKLEKQLEQLDQLTTKTTKVTQEVAQEEPIKEQKATAPKMEDAKNLRQESTPPKEEEKNNIEIIEKPKRVFQKTTKNGSKAIMVRPNQLENLKNSRIDQENKLEEIGVFQDSASLKNTLKTSIEIKKEIPDDIERQIEDLTVKANIYYNEGETAQAQELYNKINELKKAY